jgi:hypothetical protein
MRPFFMLDFRLKNAGENQYGSLRLIVSIYSSSRILYWFLDGELRVINSPTNPAKNS